MTIPGAELVLAGGEVVAVAAGRADWISLSGQSAASIDLGILTGEVPALSGTPDGRLLVAIPGRAIVKVCSRSGCDGAIGRLNDAGSRFGTPRMLADVVLVPDPDRGTIHLVRTAQGAEFSRAEVMAPGTEFDVLVHEGFVFYNAVGNEKAGVLRITGQFIEIPKYRPENPSEGLDTPATSVPSTEAPTTPSEGPISVPPTPTTFTTATTTQTPPTTRTPTSTRTSTSTSSTGTSTPATARLVIQVHGAGKVTNDFGGQECLSGADCSYSVPAGRTVNLTAVPSGTDLITWSGVSCQNAACAVTVTTDATAIATFNPAPPVIAPVISGFTCSGNPVPGEEVTCNVRVVSAGSATGWIWRVKDSADGSDAIPASTQPLHQPFTFATTRPGKFRVELTADNPGAPVSTTFDVISRVTLPDVLGRSSAESVNELRALGLTTRTENRRSHAAVGTVISTTPAAAATVNWGQSVTLLISDGPNPSVSLGVLGPSALWSNGSGVTLQWNGSDGDTRGFVRPAGNLPLTLGGSAPANSFETHPEWINGGRITGRFPLPNPVLAGDRLTGRMSFRSGSLGAVTFSVSAVLSSGSTVSLMSRGVGSPLGGTFDIDLSPAAGATVLLLTVDAGGSAAQDWAIWVNPVIQ
jgi:PASTA domain